MRISLLLLLFLTGCGFHSDPDYVAYRRDNSNKYCENLRIGQSNSYNAGGSGIRQQFYKVQNLNDSAGNHAEVSQTTLNNNNYMNRITAAQNIKNKACRDQYFRDLEFLSETK